MATFLPGTEHNTHLVLYIEEKSNSSSETVKLLTSDITSEIDTQLYITYDQLTCTYLLIGKRTDIGNLTTIPYKLRFDSVSTMMQFINLIIIGRASVTMYNHNNLFNNFARYATYSTISQSSNDMCEIVAYDNLRLSNTTFLDMLDTLKHAFNFDNKMNIF